MGEGGSGGDVGKFVCKEGIVILSGFPYIYIYIYIYICGERDDWENEERRKINGRMK